MYDGMIVFNNLLSYQTLFLDVYQNAVFFAILDMFYEF